MEISIGFAYKLQSFWHEWKIRIFVLLSEFLQLVLYFLMPYRKRTSNFFILTIINATYVISSAAAGMALAYISSGMPDRNDYQPPLLLWALFMLLHLAGVGETIAHTVDDSNMWYKRFFNFLFNNLAIFKLFTLQWHQVAEPGGWAIIAMAACLGSFLQMKLLWLGRSDLRVKHSSSQKTVEAPETVNSLLIKHQVGFPEGAGVKTSDLREEYDLVSKAFDCYHFSRKLRIPGLSFTTFERDSSREYFLALDPKDAVRIAEIELNMAYDAYFTNGLDHPPNSKRGTPYLILCLIYHSSVLAIFTTVGIRISFLSLSDLEDKYNSRDKLITRVLCFSTVFLNLLALLKFLISDHVIANWKLKILAKLPHKRRWRSSDEHAVNNQHTSCRSTSTIRKYMNGVVSSVVSVLKSLARIFFRRWSETLTRRSFMIECLREATIRSSPLPRIFIQWRVTQVITSPTLITQWYSDDAGEFIFTHLKKKAESSESLDDAQNIFKSMGDGLLLQSDLLSFFLDKPYDLRLLLWHIATEILYYKVDHRDQKIEPRYYEDRKMSNLLSEYMMYLVFERRRIMSTWRGNFILRYREISKHIKIQKKQQDLVKWYRWSSKQSEKQLENIYDNIIAEYRSSNGVIKQPMVLQEAVKIAEEMRKLNKKEMWKVVSEVWVELLTYAATHCDPISHVQKLAEGGELITIVWLLSAHLGFGDYFISKEEEDSYAD